MTLTTVILGSLCFGATVGAGGMMLLSGRAYEKGVKDAMKKKAVKIAVSSVDSSTFSNQHEEN